MRLCLTNSFPLAPLLELRAMTARQLARARPCSSLAWFLVAPPLEMVSLRLAMRCGQTCLLGW